MPGSVARSAATWLIFIAAVVLAVQRVVADQHEYNLIHSIMRDYDPSIRPSLNHNHTLNVTFGLALTQLIDVVSAEIISFTLVDKLNPKV
jgi:uncharacterized membrane protein YecN with MAPEG domain